jgi:F-type H+-transporting ATPase subunit a
VEETRKWRWGVNRWFVFLFVILGVLAAKAFPPILPHVQLPAEELAGPITLPLVGEIYLTNTIVATLIVDLIVLLLAFAVHRAIRSGELVFRGVVGAIQTVLEALYGLAETTAGKWAKQFFPWMASIVLIVLMANWMELIPGVDSIGEVHGVQHEGYPIQELGQFGNLSIITIVKQSTQAAEASTSGSYSIVPFVRVVSTDLNFTVALALTVVVMVQVYGIRALGLSYFKKFINVKPIFSKPIFGVIDFAVGLLEIVSEISRIISFSFRLFGNIFAGSILLFVIGSLVPVFAQTIFLALEFGVGLIQAIVFGMLAMIFMAQATAGHGDEAHEGA